MHLARIAMPRVNPIDKKIEGDPVAQVAFDEFTCSWWVTVHPYRCFRFEHEPRGALVLASASRILVW